MKLASCRIVASIFFFLSFFHKLKRDAPIGQPLRKPLRKDGGGGDFYKKHARISSEKIFRLLNGGPL